jgi:hypothetical protein
MIGVRCESPGAANVRDGSSLPIWELAPVGVRVRSGPKASKKFRGLLREVTRGDIFGAQQTGKANGRITLRLPWWPILVAAA